MQMQVRNVGLSGIAIAPDRRMRALRPDKVDELAASMRECGLLQPIVLQPRGNGHAIGFGLIAGRHRYEAARKLKWKSISALVLEGLDADQARLAEIDENLIRADLGPAEQAAHLAERKRLYEMLHPEAKRGGAPGAGRGKGKARKADKLSSFQTDAAAKTGKDPRTIRRSARRGEQIPNVAQLAGTVLDKGDELDALADPAMPQPRRAELMERAKAGERVSAKAALKQEKRAKREAELRPKIEAESAARGVQVFGVIYADPPWRFEPYSRESGMDRAADNHYPTMTQDDLAALDLPAANDCVLFCWATVAMLPAGMAFLSDHGFTYRSAYFWLKPGPGTGYWSAVDQVEILLVGTKGSVPAPAQGQQPPQCQAFPRGRHSEKPDAFADMIVRMFPTLPRIEMFARKARADWCAWGAEAP
jgi:N6-adenosine-specific RNA methylase IME4